jgi:hypothetical protein
MNDQKKNLKLYQMDVLIVCVKVHDHCSLLKHISSLEVSKYTFHFQILFHQSLSQSIDPEILCF